MKRFSNSGSLFLVLFFTLSILIAFAGRDGKLKGKIVCFGDSITFGASFEGNGWPDQLQKLSSNINVVNEGRKGRKTSDFNELFPVIEKNKDADYFIFLLGVNDLKDGTDSLVNSCVANMKYMIEKIKAGIPGVKIILMSPCQINLEGMSELNKGKKYNINTFKSLITLEIKYKELAVEENVRFISLLNVVSQKNLFDGIHPDIEGYKEITEKIWNDLNNMN